MQLIPQQDIPSVTVDTVAVPAPTDLALRYHRTGNVLWAVETGFSLLLPALLLFTGLSSRIRTLAQRAGRRWLVTLAVYALLFTLLTAVVTLPLSYYTGFLRQHEYGLSNQSQADWLGDWLKGVAVSGLGLSLVLWIPYLLLRRSPRRWWLYSGLASLPIAALVLVITPLWVDPLFNDLRLSEGPKARVPHTGAGCPGRHRRKPGLSSRQECGHEDGQCVRDRDRSHQANRSVGHSGG